MHFAEWIKREGISDAEAARRLNLPNAMTVRRYRLKVWRPRAERIADIHRRTDGLVTLADWYPEMPGDGSSGDAADGQINGTSALSS